MNKPNLKNEYHENTRLPQEEHDLSIILQVVDGGQPASSSTGRPFGALGEKMFVSSGSALQCGQRSVSLRPQRCFVAIRNGALLARRVNSATSAFLLRSGLCASGSPPTSYVGLSEEQLFHMLP